MRAPTDSEWERMSWHQRARYAASEAGKTRAQLEAVRDEIAAITAEITESIAEVNRLRAELTSARAKLDRARRAAEEPSAIRDEAARMLFIIGPDPQAAEHRATLELALAGAGGRT